MVLGEILSAEFRWMKLFRTKRTRGRNNTKTSKWQHQHKGALCKSWTILKFSTHQWTLYLILSLANHVLKGPSQPLLCFQCLHLERRLTKLLEISTKRYLITKRIVRLTVEWFLSRENNRWLGWKRITQSIRIFDGR